MTESSLRKAGWGQCANFIKNRIAVFMHFIRKKTLEGLVSHSLLSETALSVELDKRRIKHHLLGLPRKQLQS